MILKRSFGRTASGIETFLYEIKNTAGASVSVTDYGARIVSINVPDRDGKVREGREQDLRFRIYTERAKISLKQQLSGGSYPARRAKGV